MTAPLLRVDDLVRDYRGGLFGRGVHRRALDGVSFEVAAGEIFGIVGESGCGKSTLARLVSGLDRPTAGRIRLAGTELGAASRKDLRKARRDVQMVFQDPYGSLDPRHRVARIVAEPLHAVRPRVGKAEAALQARAALADVGLSDADALRFAHEFSGGQRQRIAIARALVTRPRLVVADEPVSALDVSVQAQVLNLVLDLRDRGIGFLFISHDLRVVETVCDRVGVMYRGRIVEEGPTPAVLGAPLHPYTRLLRGDAIDPAEPRGEAGVDADAAGWSGCAFRLRCPLAVERCRTQTPAPRSPAGASPARIVACHRAGETP